MNMKQLVKYMCLLVAMFAMAACDFLNVPDHGPQIKGDEVEMIPLTSQQYEVLSRIFTLSNPKIKAKVDSYDKLSEEVLMVSTQRELQSLCPEGVTAPTIDFQQHCFVYAFVATPTLKSEIREVKLYLQKNGTATFFAHILATSVDPLIGLAIPYGVFDVPESNIKDLEIVSRTVFY